MKTEFKYNKQGILEVWRDGKKVGEISTMGDLIKKEKDDGVQTDSRHREPQKRNHKSDAGSSKTRT